MKWLSIWKKYLIKENAETSNTIKRFKFELNLSDKELLDLARKYPFLRKLKKHLGRGSFGTVYLLDNDRVVKFIERATRNMDFRRDFAWYKQQYEKTFSGNLDKHELPIFDLGVIEAGGLKVPYVEMPRLIEFIDYCHQARCDPRAFMQMIRLFEQEQFEQLKQYTERIIENELVSADLAKAFYEFLTYIQDKYEKQSLDLSIGNIGILPQNGQIVLFDPYTIA